MTRAQVAAAYKLADQWHKQRRTLARLVQTGTIGELSEACRSFLLPNGLWGVSDLAVLQRAQEIDAQRIAKVRRAKIAPARKALEKKQAAEKRAQRLGRGSK